MPHNRFKKLFALAKELDWTIHELRAAAQGYTGTESLRSLNHRQLADLENKLQVRVNKQFRDKRARIAREYEANSAVFEAQREFLIDVITAVFDNMGQFRSWLRTYFDGIDHERFLDSATAKKAIHALQEMRSRGYSVR